MASVASELPGFQAKLAFTRRKFHAWWEGYAFDAAAERAAILARFPGAADLGARPVDEIVPEIIWGEGRQEPGAPVWTMRFARMLSLPVRAHVIVFGAGGGAPLNDLKHGTRWKVSGLTRYDNYSHGELRSYDNALQKLHKASTAGALSFFELHRDPDPVAFTRLAAELLLPGAKAVFVDFTVARKGARLRSCFPAFKYGAPRNHGEYETILRDGGFTMTDYGDETGFFMPLIAEGWAGWRQAYEAISNIENMRIRVDLMRGLAAHAHLWAERFDALRSGQLQVTRFQVTRN